MIPSTHPFASPSTRALVLSLALGLITLAAYLPIRDNGFINFDDPAYITQNAHITRGLNWDTVKWAFTTNEAANWHPLTWLSHALDRQLFGLNPLGHHLTSVFLHALNAVILFLLLQSMTGYTWRSFVVAALFAVHPLNVESVAWAAERKNVLSMFFFLLGLSAYACYTRAPKVRWYTVVAGLFALGLMAKPQIITFPFVLLLLDYWPLERMRFDSAVQGSDRQFRRTAVLRIASEKVPLALLSAASAMITIYAQRAGHAVRTIVEYGLKARVENAAVSYVRYLGFTFFPRHLAPIYPHPGNSLPIWEVVLCAALIVGVTAFVVRCASHGYLPVGWFWFIGTLVPMIGLLQVGEQAMADRYTYLPMVGIFILMVWGVADATHHCFPEVGKSTLPLAAVTCLVIAGLFIATFRQVRLWRNSETLWTYTLGVTRHNYMAEDNLAQELAHQGRVQEALIHFHAAESWHKYDPEQVLALGIYEQRNGYTADAIRQFESVLQSTSNPTLRSVALTNEGLAYLELKDDVHAHQDFDNAVRLDASSAPAILGAGIVAHRSGNLELAIAQYRKSLSIKPSDLGYMLLGTALDQSGKKREAAKAYEEAAKLSQDLQQTRAGADRLLTR